MKEIEGIDLSSLFSEVENEILAEKKKEVAKKVSGIVLNLQQWRRSREDKKKEMDKLDGKIAKAEEKLRQIQAGNWSVIEDEQPGQKDKTKGPQAASDDSDD